MTREEEECEFGEALRRLPPPIVCFSDGAVCPWCGALHQTITFGENTCEACRRYFCFGYPPWGESKEPCSYVPFPWREFRECGNRASLLRAWSPNDRLKELYHQMAEERTGIYADTGKPQ